jgi:hypothetical protein
MRLMKMAAAAAAFAALGGCAEMATTMMMVSDQLAAEQGYYYDDAHDRRQFGGNCPALVESGIVNNQSYVRVRNTSSRPIRAKVTWNSGFESPFNLGPGETSDFVYMSPSIQWSYFAAEC